MSYIPVIDLGQPDAVLAPLIDDICTNIGFFQITGHGIDNAVASNLWNKLRDLFDLPLSEKLLLQPPSSEYPYGYIPVSAESLAKSLGGEAPGDLKESFNIGPVEPPRHSLAGPDEALVYSDNLWPPNVPGLEKASSEYYGSMTALSERIMRLFALALGLDADFFDDMIDHAPSALRAINYPQTERPLAKGQLRAGAHTDYGLLTILRQDDVGGLEVQDQQGTWTSVPSIDRAYVINIGDLMARWTNDRWRSTLHRVVNPVEGQDAAARRQSVPFFYNANFDAEVRCLPSCLPESGVPIYEPVLAGPHLLEKFGRSVVTR